METYAGNIRSDTERRPYTARGRSLCPPWGRYSEQVGFFNLLRNYLAMSKENMVSADCIYLEKWFYSRESQINKWRRSLLLLFQVTVSFLRQLYFTKNTTERAEKAFGQSQNLTALNEIGICDGLK